MLAATLHEAQRAERGVHNGHGLELAGRQELFGGHDRRGACARGGQPNRSAHRRRAPDGGSREVAQDRLEGEGDAPIVRAPGEGCVALYKSWLSTHADPTQQRLQQTAAGIFADDLNRPSSHTSLLAQTESTQCRSAPGVELASLRTTTL